MAYDEDPAGTAIVFIISAAQSASSEMQLTFSFCLSSLCVIMSRKNTEILPKFLNTTVHSLWKKRKSLLNLCVVTKYCQRGDSWRPNQCCGYKAIMSVMLWTRSQWWETIIARRTTTEFSGDFPVLNPTSLPRPIHRFPVAPASPALSLPIACFHNYALFTSVIPLQLQRDAYVTQHTMHDHRRRCLSERNQFSPSVLALPFPIAQSPFFLLWLACVLSLSCLCEWTVGVPLMVTN